MRNWLPWLSVLPACAITFPSVPKPPALPVFAEDLERRQAAYDRYRLHLDADRDWGDAILHRDGETPFRALHAYALLDSSPRVRALFERERHVRQIWLWSVVPAELVSAAAVFIAERHNLEQNRMSNTGIDILLGSGLVGIILGIVEWKTEPHYTPRDIIDAYNADLKAQLALDR